MLKRNIIKCISSSGNKSKTIWIIINSETNNKQHRYNNTEPEINSHKHSEPNFVANYFSDFYTMSDNSIKFNNKDGNNLNGPVDFSVFLNPTDTWHSAIDDISGHIIKKCSNLILEPLTFLFNKCLSAGIFPSCLKKTVVTPFFKKDDYRTISQLTNFSKILEQLVYDMLLAFFNK